ELRGLVQAWSPTNGRKARREGVHIPRNLCLDWRGGCHERACVVHDGSLEPEDGVNYVIGVDLGLKRDRTAVAVCHSERLCGDEDPTVGARVVLDRIQVWQGSRLKPVKLLPCW